MRKIGITLILTLFITLLFLPRASAAEETPTTPTITMQHEESTAIPSPTQQQNEPTKPLTQYNREMKQNLQAQKTTMEDNTQEKMRTMRLEHKDLLESIKEKREAVKVEYQQQKDQFKKRLQSLHDEKKKIVVERVDSRLSTINTNHAQRMTAAIQELEKILDKISTKTAELKTKGLDVTTVEAAIAKANTAVDAAKDTLSTQAAKQYIADITSETNLGQTVSVAVTQLRTDLKAAHQSVQDARSAVRNAATELAKIIVPKMTPEITSTIRQ